MLFWAGIVKRPVGCLAVRRRKRENRFMGDEKEMESSQGGFDELIQGFPLYLGILRPQCFEFSAGRIFMPHGELS